MDTLICYFCGGHEFMVVEFRNTRNVKVSHEEIDLICQNCGLVMFTIRGRAEYTQKVPKTAKKRWLRR